MLTQSQYNILLLYRDHPQRFCDGLPEDHELLEQRGYISATDFASNDLQICYPIEWSITPLGMEALERFEQYREKCAAEKRQQEEDRAQRAADKKEQRRHEWIVAIVSACCGSVLTLLVEHFDVILVCLAQLLGFHVPS